MAWLPETIPPMQLKEFCERLAVDYRAARYVLEEGLVPKGVEKHPERGNHRALTAAQAYWLGFLLYLKQSGVKSPIAAKVADFAAESVNTLSQNLGYERSFSPFKGRLTTERQWDVEVGDLEVIRISVNPDPLGKNYTSSWTLLGTRKNAPQKPPIVILRVDLSLLAARLRG